MPAWDQIRLAHVMPAFAYALEQAHEALDRIIDNKAAPTYQNTVEAIEHADELAAFFAGIIFNTMPRPRQKNKYEQIIRKIARMYQDYFSRLYSSDEIYKRVCAVRDSGQVGRLTAEQKYLLESYETGFKDEGILLSEADRATLKDYQNRIMQLELTSQSNMARAENETIVAFSQESDIAGLPGFARDEAAQKAQECGRAGKWAFCLDQDSYMVFMETVTSRKARARMYRAYHRRATRGRFDNRETIMALNDLYQRRAKLVGYVSMADMELGSHMAMKPGTVGKFLKLVRKVAQPQARRETAQIRGFAREHCGIEDLQPWDLLFVREKMKSRMLGFDNEDLRPYFALENVLGGVFGHFQKLYGLRFRETGKYPVYHREVRAFEVSSARTGVFMGVLFLDLFARAGKPAGVAWSVPVVSQGMFLGRARKAVNVIVMKLPRPARGRPALLSHDDVQTLFHEMGHATHDLLSDVQYQSLAGTNVVSDFLEFPSQIAENWAYEPQVLDSFAFHFQTGAPMPDHIKERLIESRSFMAASRIVSHARRGWLDLAWAEAQPGRVRSVAAFEKRVLRAFGWNPKEGEMISPSFSHIFGGGYEMSFYGYQWAEALAADAYSLFEKKGIYDRYTASRLKHLKRQGGSRDSGTLYREFRFRCAQMTQFFSRLGLFMRAVVPMDMLYSCRRSAATAVPARKRALRRATRKRQHRGRFID